ncbi:putative Ataxin-1 [Hypsibius exemplaris]|uniref:Ataxin-1 n=1 Tax=Hypsibius exemplaris TaxID=2072580 RepID=A0A9X6NER0_HYPEX|nr:putative Ataxin-1 [Hypsibius exemplaris]
MAETVTDENMQEGSPSTSRSSSAAPPSTSSNRPFGKEGSLKHRILSRPTLATTSSTTDGGAASGSGDDMQSRSSNNSTPVASPSSSSHSATATAERMDIQTAGNTSTVTIQTPKKRARISNDHSYDSSSPSPNHHINARPHSELSKSTNSTPSASSRSAASTPSHSPHAAGAAAAASIGQSAFQPDKFNRGSLIQLASGELKAIEAMTQEDFLLSAAATPTLKADFSEIARVERQLINGQTAVVVHFRVGKPNSEVVVEASEDHPFFVLGKGWSSASPPATQARFGLRVNQLVAGDTCISLSSKEPNLPHGAGYNNSMDSSGHLQERNSRVPENSHHHHQSRGAAGPALPTMEQQQQMLALAQMSGADLASFRRWSAPEDDRFMENLAKHQKK